MKKAVFALVAIAFAFALTSCATNFTTSNGKLAYTDVKGSAVGTLKAEKRIMYIFHPAFIQLGDKTQEKLDTIIDPQVQAAGGTSVRNLKVTYNFDFLAFVVQYILPLGMPNIEVTGEIVK